MTTPRYTLEHNCADNGFSVRDNVENENISWSEAIERLNQLETNNAELAKSVVSWENTHASWEQHIKDHSAVSKHVSEQATCVVCGSSECDKVPA